MHARFLSSILILGVLIQSLRLMVPHTGLSGASPAWQVDSPNWQCVENLYLNGDSDENFKITFH